MCETYPEQVKRLAHALSRGQFQAIEDDLQAASPARLQLFADGNRDRRSEKLSDHLEFIAEAFDDLEHLIDVYVRQHPMAAFDSVVNDAERMLLWLLDKRSLLPEQRDYVLCQRARHAVEELARCHRAGHVAFQHLRSASREQPQIDPAATVLHVNPVRANATFITQVLLNDQSHPPTEVLFFPDGHEIASAVLPPVALSWLLTLSEIAPCSLTAWAERIGGEVAELLPTAVDMLEAGLIATESK